MSPAATAELAQVLEVSEKSLPALRGTTNTATEGPRDAV
jgi:hypothetical protein